MKVIRKEHFSCQQGCGYELCLDCSNKPAGFVGTAFDDFFKGFQNQTSDEIERESE
jgi:hypothetical protein